MKTKLGRPAKWNNRTVAMRLPEFMKDLILELAKIGDDEGFDLGLKKIISYKSGGVLETVSEVVKNKDRYFVQKSNSKAKTEHQPDFAYDAFCASYLVLYQKPYQSKRGDFIKIAGLRKRLGDGVTLKEWKVAVANYFLTPQGRHTLADLCERYDTFCLYALNEYNKPANGGRVNVKLSPEERKLAEIAERRAREDAEVRGFDSAEPLRIVAADAAECEAPDDGNYLVGETTSHPYATFR